MRRIILWGSLGGLASCALDPAFVQIIPDYGYVDGCTAVTLQGHSLGETATATIGGVEIADLAPAAFDDSSPEWAQNVGFDYTGTTPPAPGGVSGFYDVTMNVDGEALTIPEAFYYRACPASFQVDHTFAIDGDGNVNTTTTPGVAGGDTIALDGCGLSDQVTVQLMQYTGAYITNTTQIGTVTTTTDVCGNAAFKVGDPIALTSVCGTAQAQFTLPADLADGQYYMWFSHTDGTLDDGYYLYYGYPYCHAPSFVVGATTTTGGTQ